MSIKQIGQAIKKLRRGANFTGEELGRRAGLSQSKVSKIETGFYARLNHKEIKKLLNILNAPSDISQQILLAIDDATHASGNSRVAFRTQLRPPAVSNSLEARRIRVFSVNVLPPMLQTTEYKTALLEHREIDRKEFKAHLKSLLARQDLMWDGRRNYHMIIPQTVLYTVAGSKRMHVAQLDRVERIMGLTNVKVGIVPTEAGMPLIGHGAFALFDNRILFQALAHYELESREPLDIELYDSIFAELTRLAVYDDDAVQLVRDAMDYFR